MIGGRIPVKKQMNKVEVYKLVDETKVLLKKALENQRRINEYLEDTILEDDAVVIQDVNKNIAGKELEKIVTDIIIKMGITANLIGFRYIRTSLILAVNDMNMLNYITKSLYSDVAALYNTTAERVERGIRHAIEVAWYKGNRKYIESFFDYTIPTDGEKPTNAKFIAMVAEKVYLQTK